MTDSVQTKITTSINSEPSPCASAYRDATGGLQQAETARHIGDVECADWLEADAHQQLAGLDQPATIEQLQEIDVVVKQEAGNLRLHDTSKSPTMVAANANAKRLGLAEQAGALDLALDVAATIQPTNSLERLLGDQLAATHAHAMRLMRQADRWSNLSETEINFHTARATAASIEAARLTNAAARMMRTYQDGMMALARVRSGGQKVTVVHQYVQVAGGQVAVAGHVSGKRGG